MDQRQMTIMKIVNAMEDSFRARQLYRRYQSLPGNIRRRAAHHYNGWLNGEYSTDQFERRLIIAQDERFFGESDH